MRLPARLWLSLKSSAMPHFVEQCFGKRPSFLYVRVLHRLAVRARTSLKVRNPEKLKQRCGAKTIRDVRFRVG
jgi:hypothetical protein